LPTKKLTDLFVERVGPPAKGRVEYFDASFPGLALRITDKGAKSWSVFYRLNGRLRRFTIGSYPAIKPAEARRAAQSALDTVRGGSDPIEEKRARREQQNDTFASVLEDYLERQAKPNTRRSTYLEMKRAIERDALAKWQKRPIGSITKRDVIDLVDEIIARGARVQANRTLARLKTFFKWAAAKQRIAASPIADMELPTEEQTRDRVLSDDELRWLWTACSEIGWPFGPLVQLLVLTAQRRDEVAGMARAEIVFADETWTIPRERTKNGIAHEVQLCGTAMAILESLPHIGGAGLIFTTTGETPVSGFSRAKRRLDDAVLAAKRSELGKQKDDAIADWTLHDLRRTAATGMARLKILPHVVDRILNHTSGTIRGVAKIYNRFAYLDERRAALEAWGRYVDNLIIPAPANVIEIRRA
jgi:integrase